MARMLKPYNWLIVILVFAALFAGAPLVAQTLSPKQAVKPSPAAAAADHGPIVPDQMFETINKQTISLHQFRGREILVHFWATWCLPCIKEFPALIEAARNNPQIVVITISVDRSQTAMLNFLSKVDGATTLPNVHNVLDQLYKIQINNTPVRAYPETFIIRPDLTLRGHVKGGLEWTKIKFEK